MHKSVKSVLSLPVFLAIFLILPGLPMSYGAPEEPVDILDCMEATWPSDTVSIDQNFTMFNESGMSLGDIEIWPDSDNGLLHDIIASPYGPGILEDDIETPGLYHATFDDMPGVVSNFYKAPSSCMLDFTIGNESGWAHHTTTSVVEVPPGGSSVISAYPVKIEGRKGFWFRFNFGEWGPYIYWADWLQFFTATFTYGLCGENGEYEVTFDPNNILGTPSNGGSPNGQNRVSDLATGQGLFTASGGTTYVDSVMPGVPTYLDAGMAGERGSNFIEMSDAPTFPLNEIRAHVDVDRSMQGVNPNDALMWIKAHYDFTTYLIVNGYIVYVIYWSWEATHDCHTGQMEVDCNIIWQGSASSLDPTHQAALDNFLMGNFHGA